MKSISLPFGGEFFHKFIDATTIEREVNACFAP